MIQLFKIISICLTVFVFTNNTYAQNKDADKIVGTWLTSKKDGKIEIYKSGNLYYGKLIWGKTLIEKDGSQKKDIHNPDKKLQNRTLLNLVLLTGFTFKDGYWQDGKIYDPESGKTYSSEMKLVDNKLHLTGYIGITLFGRTEIWERVK